MCQHRATHTVTDGIHALYASATFVVDNNESAIIQLNARIVGKQVRRVRLASDRNHELVDLDRLLAILVVKRDLNAFLAKLRGRHLRAKSNIKSLLFELLRGYFRDIAIGQEQKIVHRFEHRDVGTEARPDAAELESNDTCTNDTQSFRHFVELQRTPGIHDLVIVEWRDTQLYRRRSGSENHVSGIDFLDLAVKEVNSTCFPGEQLCRARPDLRSCSPSAVRQSRRSTVARWSHVVFASLRDPARGCSS